MKKAYLAIFAATAVGMTIMMSRYSSAGPTEGDFAAITLTHDTEPSIKMKIPLRYLDGDAFLSTKNAADGKALPEIKISFFYPGFGGVREMDLPIGDCQDDNICRYYASLRVAKKGATARFFEMTYASASPDAADAISGLRTIKGEASENLLVYYHDPDKEFPSGVLVTCMRASPANIARCRIYFETRLGVGVILGGVKDDELPRWRDVVSDTSVFVDGLVG